MLQQTNRATVLDHPCTGKVRFDDSRTAATVSDRRNHRGQPGRAYRCPSCSGWHIGSEIKRSKPARPPRWACDGDDDE